MTTASESQPLPPPGPDQAYMSVSALEGGHVDIPVAYFLEGAPDTERLRVPALSFLLTHSKTGTKLVFDLGIRKDIETFPPHLKQRIKSFLPVHVQQDVAESLAQGGVKVDDIQYVILSHLHFDHIGDASLFPKSTFVIGGGSRKLLENPYPQNPTSSFSADYVPNDGRTRYLDSSEFQTSIAGFPQAFDFFNDGSLYIVDAPGHLDGHINVLARTSSTGGWIFLAGDTCHHLKLFDGGKIPCIKNEQGGLIFCAHGDKVTAELHIERVKQLRKKHEVLIVIAHDYEWYEENKETSFLPKYIPSKA